MIDSDRKNRILKQLNTMLSGSEAYRKELAEELLKGDRDALFALEWIDGKYKAFWLGVYAKQVRSMLVAEGVLEDNIKVIVDYLQNEKDHWSPTHTTSVSSNRQHLARYEALKELLESWYFRI